MATIKHAAYGTIASALTTELNSLATATNSSASAAIDNTSALDLLVDLELVVTYGTNPTAGTTVDVYMVQALDGTNYSDVDVTAALSVGSFPLKASTSAQRIPLKDVPIPPGLFKLFVRNLAGQTMAASGNTLKYRTHDLTVA